MAVFFSDGRAGNQARASRRRAFRAKPRNPARDGSAWRDCRSGLGLPRPYLGRSGRDIGLGDPIGTDIAFSLGVMALLGRRVPSSRKHF
jgi:hypothetical protein